MKVKAALPLEPGSRVEGDSGETTLLNIVPHESMLPSAAPRSDGVVLMLRESCVRQWAGWSPLTGVSYMLRNRTRNEALLGRSYPKDIFGRFPALHRLVVNRSPIYFTAAGIPNYQGPTISDEWLRHAELLRVESRFIGQFSKSVTVENFVMNSR